MRAVKPAPVARLLANSAMAAFPPDNRSPMIPDPTTVARSRAVPTPSAVARRASEREWRVLSGVTNSVACGRQFLHRIDSQQQGVAASVFGSQQGAEASAAG